MIYQRDLRFLTDIAFAYTDDLQAKDEQDAVYQIITYQQRLALQPELISDMADMICNKAIMYTFHATNALSYFDAEKTSYPKNFQKGLIRSRQYFRYAAVLSHLEDNKNTVTQHIEDYPQTHDILKSCPQSAMEMLGENLSVDFINLSLADSQKAIERLFRMDLKSVYQNLQVPPQKEIRKNILSYLANPD